MDADEKMILGRGPFFVLWIFTARGGTDLEHVVHRVRGPPATARRAGVRLVPPPSGDADSRARARSTFDDDDAKHASGEEALPEKIRGHII